ncbi:hypothetical protein N665_0583s0009 [Sinapis alba]|nr:hypothetical protein N665_0583s0009 [Sinapis alba]
MEEINALYDEARRKATGMKKLVKLEDSRKFVVPCPIKGVDFPDALCDTWSTVSIMSKDIANKLGLASEALKITLTFTNYSTNSPLGTINNMDVRLGNCIVPINFHMLEMGSRSSIHLILGRDFIATVGMIRKFWMEALEYNHITLGGNGKEKKMRSKIVKDDPYLTLVPQTSSDGVIECKVHIMVLSQPFAKEVTIYES